MSNIRSVLGIVACIVAAAAVTGCTYTEFSGYADPSYRGQQRFDSVMVYGHRMGLGDRELVETTMAQAFASNGIEVVRSMDHVPPTRRGNTEAIAREADRLGVDALLVLTLVDTAIDESYVPPTYHPGRTTATINRNSDYAYVDIYTSPGYTTGGFTEREEVAAYAANVFDVNTANRAWTGEALSRAIDFAGFRELAIEVSNRTVREAVADGIFLPTHPME